jgi:DNA polymerase-1
MKPQLPPTVQLDIVDDMDSVRSFIDWFSQWCGHPSQEMFADTETTGLNRSKDVVRGFQVGNGDVGYFIPVDRWEGLARDVLTRYPGKFGFHNSPFDVRMIRNTFNIEIPVERIIDTRPMAAVLEPNRPNALKMQASQHVDERASIGQIKLDALFDRTGTFWDTVDIRHPDFWVYGALDPVLTARLKAHHWPAIESTGAHKAYDLELAASWITAEMGDHGVPIDTEYAAQQVSAFEQQRVEIGNRVQEEYGCSAGSDKNLIEVLERDGVVFTVFTETGRPSLKAEVLETLDHPLANLIRTYRRLRHTTTNYLDKFTASDGMMYPDINSIGAKTRRMSISKPSFQNLPRANMLDPIATSVRNCVKARPDHVLILCDFSQVEARILAWMAGSATMREMFKSDTDFFIGMARLIYQDDSIMKGDPRRDLTKNGTYATIYGAGAEKFAATARVPLDMARAFRTRWDALLPEVGKFTRKVQDVAWIRQRDQGRPYARSPLTGSFFVADINKVYSLVNYIIQGIAAEILKMKLIELYSAGLGPWMMLPVHDEVILEVPITDVLDAVHTVESIMNDEHLISVPLTASVSFAERWGSKKDWSLDAWEGYLNGTQRGN